jgi:hypothetical protein
MASPARTAIACRPRDRYTCIMEVVAALLFGGIILKYRL